MPSSPIAAVGAHRHDDRLIEALGQVPDPRRARGRRYPLAGMLAVAVSAVLAGARSFVAIGEWAADLAPDLLAELGLAPAPEQSTLRKLFTCLDATALDAALAVWAWTRTRDVDGRRVIAIDGKTLRGARVRAGADPGSAPHLIAALDHRNGVVLGQRAVAAKSNEIPAVRDLLASFDPDALAGSVITVDAMHTVSDTAQAILHAGADYVFTVKANTPRLQAALKKLPWGDVPVGSRSTQHGHGRRATRTIKVLQMPQLPDWPEFAGASQIAQLRRTVTRNRNKTVEVIYLITPADYKSAPPATLAAWVQGHWHVEALHWIRDVTFDEDRSQVRTGHAAQVMASLRNTAINLLRLAGATNIAAALRHHARGPTRAINCLLERPSHDYS
jgi:predicted transposase YbfD/YdcC